MYYCTYIQSIVKAHDTLFIPFAMSTNGALGPEASKFITMVFLSSLVNTLTITKKNMHTELTEAPLKVHVLLLRHRHQDAESTWNSTWFSTFCANGFLQQLQLPTRLS